MSEDQAWKRSQAVDTITSHPWALDMLKSGETKLTQLAMIKPKLTKANEEIIKEFIPGKSKAEVKAFLETVGLNGERLDPSEYVEIRLRVKKETAAATWPSQKPSCAGADEKTNAIETKKSRYVKAEVKHAVMCDGEEGCDYTGPNGKRCGSIYKLQYEHVVPFAMGGEHSPENGKKYCAPHNQYQADLMFGRNFMDEKRYGVVGNPDQDH